jgi:N,N'-diacetyllegionaminate synthase
MATMREKFNLSVGYSDHTLGTTVTVAAAALGAAVIEKHFTLDCTLEGPDHKASLIPSELAYMVSQIRMVELTLGNGDKTPRESELPIRDVARRSLTLTRAVKAGEKITPQILSLMRPGNGIAPKHLNDITGMKSVRDLAAWTTLTWDDISS